MSDKFEDVALVPGCEVLIRAPGEVNVVGVVAEVDHERRSVKFTDGRVYVFPPVAEPEEVKP